MEPEAVAEPPAAASELDARGTIVTATGAQRVDARIRIGPCQ